MAWLVGGVCIPAFFFLIADKEKTREFKARLDRQWQVKAACIGIVLLILILFAI